MSHKVEPERLNHNATAGISIAAFVVVVAVSLAYYQFVYVLEASTKPIFPDSLLAPKEMTRVTIIEGAVL